VFLASTSMMFRNLMAMDAEEMTRALGRLGWTLRRIQKATGVRRETASAYLRTAGISIRAPRHHQLPAKPASVVSTDLGTLPAGIADVLSTPPPAGRAPAASACEPYREVIEAAVARGRDAMAIWRDLVDDHGFPAQYASVRRFVITLRGRQTAEAHPVIMTAPGEEGQVDYGDARWCGIRRRASTAARDCSSSPWAIAARRPAAHLPVQHPALGRAARRDVSPAGRGPARHHPRQLARGRAHARHL
jgi:hypothetical protein